MRSTGSLVGWYRRFVDQLTPLSILRKSCVVAVVVGGLVYLLAPPQYSADTSLLFSQRPETVQNLGLMPAPGGLQGGVSLPFFGNSDPTEKWTTALVESRAVRQRLVDKYHLGTKLGVKDPREALDWLGSCTLVKGIQKGISVGANIGLRIVVTVPGPSRLMRWCGVNRPFDTPTAKQLAADLANEYLAVVSEEIVKGNTDAAGDVREFIVKRDAQVSTDLRRVEDELQQLRSQYMLMEPVSQATQLGTRVAELTDEVARLATEERNEAQSLATARQGLSRQQAQKVTQEVQARNPLIVRLESESADLRAQLATARAAGKGPEHPEVLALQRGLQENEAQLKGVATEVLNEVVRGTNPVHESLLQRATELEVSVAGLRAGKAERSRQLSLARQAFASLPPVARRYGELERERAILAEVLTTLRRRLEVANIEARQETTSKLQQLDPAVPPTKKSGPSTSRTVAGAFLLSLLILGALWAQRHDLIFGSSNVPAPTAPDHVEEGL